jgi:mannose-1-phosphate guanylyltransferase
MPKDSVFDHAYAVVMAGGSGTRFWPLSRRKHPKQLLELFGRGSLLEQTVERIREIIPPERTYILTNQLLRADVARRLPHIPKSQVVAEPAPRNTAPAIGLAAHEILARDHDGVMIVLPSDQVILKRAAFRRGLQTACRLASVEGRSVTLGVKPTRPETGYGYIRLGRVESRLGNQEVYRVEKFTEKPPLALARRYVASGHYLWNAGMFIWLACTVITNLERYQPQMAEGLARIAAAGGARAGATLRRIFPKLEKISIDYALMEKVSDLFAVAVDLGWSDVGSWEVVYQLSPKDRDGSVRPKDSVSLDSQRNMIVSPRKLVVTVGVRDLVVVETKDALLVCARQRSQDVGKAVQELERRGRTDVL